MINYHLKYGHSYLFHKNSPQEPMSSNSNSTSVEDPLMWLPPYLCKCYNLFIFLFFFTRKLHVAPQSTTCCSLWNALQVIFVLFTVGTMISMMWFTIILKTSLESMKKRVTSCKSLIPSSSPHEYKIIYSRSIIMMNYDGRFFAFSKCL